MWPDINSEFITSVSKCEGIEFIQYKNYSYTDLIRSKIVKYNLNYLDSKIEIENNLIKVRHIASGFMMIKRELITTLQKAYPETKYTDDVGFLPNDKCDFLYSLFDCGIVEGHYLSEDWMFCERCAKVGRDIFVDISIDLTHTGQEDFKGSLLASLIL